MSVPGSDNPPSESPRPPRPLHWWLARLVTPLLILATGLALIFAVGLAQRMGWLRSDAQQVSELPEQSDSIHTCPMHPQIRQPGPGSCPICGMALVPATTGAESSLDEFAVRIQPAQRRLANIATAKVVREPVAAAIETVGEIAIDESRMATVASYVAGRLERLFADYTGVDVAAGDHLAVIYSPDLYAAQIDYLGTRKSVATISANALAAVRDAQQRLLETSRQKLSELGMQEAQIVELEESEKAQSRLTIFTPIGGTVIEKLAVEGKYVEAGEPIYRIADLSTIWLMLELFPEDAARIRFGQRLVAEMQSMPGKILEGRVAFIDPTVDSEKRTVGVRVEFLNDERKLRPGDYANATIYLPIGMTGEVYDADLAGRWISPMHPQIIRDEPGDCPICGMDLVPTSRYGYSDSPVAQPSSLIVPRSALLMAGRQGVVYVETEPGRFELRPVSLGPILRDTVIILEGLKEGEFVATSGNFLIDSQMQLAGKPSLIDSQRAVVATKERKTPLELGEFSVQTVAGDAGRALESLFDTYFRVHQSLANDRMPETADAESLHLLATSLQNDEAIPEGARQQLAEIASHSEHLHHLEIDAARHTSFRPISHAMVELATFARGADAEQTFYHMFCPMVKGGAGDWLQSDSGLLNPYWGATMLRCGENVQPIPVSNQDTDTEPSE